MVGLYNLKPDKVIKAFERARWVNRGCKGSHVKLTREGNPNILSIPVHKGKPIKIGLLKDQLRNQRRKGVRSCFLQMLRVGYSLDHLNTIGKMLRGLHKSLGKRLCP